MSVGEICLKYNSGELSEDEFFQIMFGISKHDLEEIVTNNQ